MARSGDVAVALDRVDLSHPALTGVTRQHFAELLVELAPRWGGVAGVGPGRAAWGLRKRLAGAGRKVKLVFTDRLLVTLVCLRHQLPHAALAELYGVDRSTVSAAVRDVWGAQPR